MAKKSFVDLMLTLAPTKPEMSLVHEERSCPTYVNDLAQQTKVIVEQQYPFGVYHVTNAGGCTWFEWAKEIFRLAGITTPLQPVHGGAYPRPARRPLHSVLINTKLPPLRSWESAVAEYLSQRKP
jgi:dTDP-4-dehydrorhamnose reductase